MRARSRHIRRKNLGGVEAGSFFAEESLQTPLDVGRLPRTQAVTLRSDPVIAEGVQHAGVIRSPATLRASAGHEGSHEGNGAPRCARWPACRGVCARNCWPPTETAKVSSYSRPVKAKARGGAKLALVDEFEELRDPSRKREAPRRNAPLQLRKDGARRCRGAAWSYRPGSARHGGSGCRVRSASGAGRLLRLKFHARAARLLRVRGTIRGR